MALPIKPPTCVDQLLTVCFHLSLSASLRHDVTFTCLFAAAVQGRQRQGPGHLPFVIVQEGFIFLMLLKYLYMFLLICFI